MHHRIHAGAVAHRRGMQDGIARRHRIDLRAIGMACRHQRAVREHGAFRLPRGAGGVEQPGEIVRRPRHDVDRLRGKQRFIIGAADGDEPVKRFRRMRRDLAVDAGRGKADARAGMIENVTELGAVQLGVRRHHGKTGVPDAEQQFEIVRGILGGDGDALTGRELEALAQGAGKPRGAAGQFAIGRR